MNARSLVSAMLLLIMMSSCDNNQGQPVKRLSVEQVRQEQLDAVKRRLQPMIDSTMAAFFDPESIRVVEERRFYSDSFGDSICMSINAKNRFGGYTGAKWYFFSPKNKEVTTGYAANVVCGQAKP